MLVINRHGVSMGYDYAGILIICRDIVIITFHVVNLYTWLAAIGFQLQRFRAGMPAMTVFRV